MKIFICVLIAATAIGGFIGGELTDSTFLLTGAAIGGIGTGAVLLGIGAFFHAQEERKKKEDLPPEMRKVFDRMLGRDLHDDPLSSVKSTIESFLMEDAAAISRGEIPEMRLIPHHAIKRDIILEAYRRDFSKLSKNMQTLNRQNFEGKIYEIKRLPPEDLDEIIQSMRDVRPDNEEIESFVRKSNSIYSIVKNRVFST